MLEQYFSEKQIVDSLLTHYGIQLTKLVLLPLGADKNASVYRGETHDKQAYFIKLKRGVQANLSCDIITLLADAGIKQVISSIKNLHGQSILRLNEISLIVFPFIEGQDGFQRELSSEQWLTLGHVMRKIHEIKVPDSIHHKIRHENFSAKWREMVRELYKQIESQRSEDEITDKFILFLKHNTSIIHQLVDRAEQLAKLIQNHLSEFVLCHADIHGGNVLIDNNDHIYIVDWDDPVMAPKERDLMFIGGGVANVWNKPHEVALFYQGYGDVEINQAILAYYRHERIVEDIAELGQQILSDSTIVEEKRIAYQHFIAQFEPNGVVEIAFQADINL